MLLTHRHCEGEAWLAAARSPHVYSADIPTVSKLNQTGALDKGIPPEKVKEFEDALKKAGKQSDIKIYEGSNP